MRFPAQTPQQIRIAEKEHALGLHTAAVDFRDCEDCYCLKYGVFPIRPGENVVAHR